MEKKKLNAIRNSLTVLVLIICGFFKIEESYAGNVMSCTNQIDSISVNPVGTLTVIFNGLGALYMCNLNSTYTVPGYTITPVVCQSWLAQMTTAMTLKKPVQMNFDYGSSTPPACAEGVAGNWAIPNPYPYWINFPAQ